MKEKYYIKNSEKIKQQAKDKRLAFNKTLPPLNLTCDYCNKLFILPGMKENVIWYLTRRAARITQRINCAEAE